MTSTFELRAGPLSGPQLVVRSFHGVEGVSRLYHFDVVCLSELEGSAFEPLVLGQAASLVIHAPSGLSRGVHGLVARVKTEGLHPTRGYQYGLRLVPRLWLLKRRKNTRIFQGLTAVQVIESVLNDAGVPCAWHLRSSYPKRTYCVQYQETDYAFVTRLLAEEGLFFYFAMPPSIDASGGAGGGAVTETVIFADAAEMYPVIASELGGAGAGGASGAAFDDVFGSPGALAATPAPAVRYHAAEHMVADEHVKSFAQRRTMRSKSVHLRDFDFQRPQLPLDSRAVLEADQTPATAAVAAFTAGRPGPLSASGSRALGAAAAASFAADPLSLEVYEHHGDHDEPKLQEASARRHLEQLRSRARVAEAVSNCRRLMPGHRFTLEGHGQTELDREYVVTRVEHRGGSPDFQELGAGGVSYENAFECVPANVPYRPPPQQRHLRQGLETATVVGPGQDEIHTDELGRIKVQFHWDRQGQRNENSSCWIRVAQAWAGASWGFQFIPRVGMEVLVTFLGGHEDRPLVTGAVYNRTHPVPFVLPGEQTRSGIRTRSTPGGQGANELSFEDAAGAEQVLIHAQRDLVQRSLWDEQHQVGHDQQTLVANNQLEQIAGERVSSVGRDEALSVGGTQTVNVAQDVHLRIGGRKSEGIDGTRTTLVNGATETNQGDENRSIKGYCSVSVGTDNEPTGYTVSVHGLESHDVSDDLTFRSQTRIVLEVGKSSIVIGPDAIRLSSSKIVVHGTESVLVMGKGPAVQLSDQLDATANTLNLYSKGGVIELSEDGAKVDGPTVTLGTSPDSPPDLEDPDEKPQTKKFKWKMLDASKQPLKNKTYTLVTQGLRKRGTTDGDGVIALDVPLAAIRAEIDLWTDTFPEGPRVHYSVLVTELPPSNVPAGAQLRLKNLGYYQGKTSDLMTPEVVVALRQFQRDNGLGETGELDGPTSAKLDEVHPT